MDLVRFKPSNLGECILELIKTATYKNLLEFKNASEEPAICGLHHSGGRLTRNKWGLWDENSILNKYFKGIGITHADDMSSIIFSSLHRALNGKNIDIDDQVRRHQAFWKERGYENGMPV